MLFRSNVHRLRFGHLLARACVDIMDKKTATLFYIISGCDYLYERVDSIYNFCYGELDVAAPYRGYVEVFSDEWWLLEFAYVLYLEHYPTDGQLILTELSKSYLDLVVSALLLRFWPSQNFCDKEIFP